MNNIFRRFLINNLFLSLILLVFGTLLFTTILSVYYQYIFPFLLLLGFSVNLLVFYIAINKSKSINQSFFLIISSFAIKFISYLIFTVIYFLFIKEIQERIIYIVVLFFIFISYTSLEISALSKIFKTTNSNG
jgi:hypothetical protein